MINIERLTKLLDQEGFSIRLADTKNGRYRFARSGELPDIYEHLWVLTYGKKPEVVASWSVISVIKGPLSCEGLCLERFQREICSEARKYELAGQSFEDCFTRVSFNSQALAWEQRLASFGPQNVRSLADSHAAMLLQTTESVRSAARKYMVSLRQINRETTIDYLVEQLKPLLSEDNLRDAGRIADVAVSDDSLRSAYQVATMLLEIFGEVVEGIKAPLRGQSFHGNLPLIWRILLIVDWLTWRSSSAEIDLLMDSN